MSGNGYLKTMDLALALRGGANEALRYGHENQTQLGFLVAAIMDGMAASLEHQHQQRQPQEDVRSDKKPGDVIIGSTCSHQWLNNHAEDSVTCIRCKEKHIAGCAALSGGECSCPPIIIQASG